ncbi:MAG: hypothetical protein CME57_02680 [Halieaceae bacterium]|nr:hypothetical protein [Halieaceae bacterium]
MKTWWLQLPSEARAVGAAAVTLIVAIMLFTWLKLLSIAVLNAQEISDMKPRIARLLGYEMTAAELSSAVAIQRQTLSSITYDSQQQSARAGAALQQTLRGFAEDAGATVTGSQLSVNALVSDQDNEEEIDPHFEVLSVNLSLEAAPIALDAFLVAVAAHRPKLAARTMEIQQVRQSRRNQDKARQGILNVRLSIVGLKAVTQ